MQASARWDRLSGFFGPPAETANHYYVEPLVMNAFLSELPGVAFALVTVFYLASTFASLIM